MKRDKSHLKIINAVFDNRERLSGNRKSGTENPINQTEIDNSESDTDDYCTDEEEAQEIGQKTRPRREIKRPDRFGEWAYY